MGYSLTSTVEEAGCSSVSRFLCTLLHYTDREHENLGSLIFILGTCLIAFARNLGMLLAARFLLGASIGMVQPGKLGVYS
jgi:predicted MFS family arabinose efflux permease